MAEKVIVRQDKQFMIQFWAADPEHPEAEELNPVQHLTGLTPYGMLLSSLGSCTTILLHTYSQNHAIHLENVEIRLRYERIFKEDCENCERISEYEEQIREEISLEGDLTQQQRDKLLQVAHFCPVAKMLEDGMKILTSLTER